MFFIGCLIGCLLGSLIGSLLGCLIGSLIVCLYGFQIWPSIWVIGDKKNRA